MEKDLIIQLQQHQIADQQKLITGLQKLSVELQKLNGMQSEMIKLLEARNAELESNQKKDSSNSSKPPSSDIGKPGRTQSLRTSSGKKPGGQSGHPGETLSFSAAPDEIITHVVGHCACCGKNISGVAVQGCERRQVYDIPPIEMMVTEHQSEIKSCPRCHAINKAAFPEGINQPTQYGPHVQKLAVYFTQYQLLPYGRTAQLFQDIFGQSVSQSFLVNNNRRFAGQLQPFVEGLKATLLQQDVLHADETGYYYKGERNWLHTLCTEKHTLYMPHAKRGKLAMDEMGVLPQYKGTLVHDFWKAYNDYSCNHALCNVHHLRDLAFCDEVLGCSWAHNAKQLLLSLLEKVKNTKESGAACLTPNQLQYIGKKYNELIKEGQNLYPPPKKIKGRRGVTKKSKSHNLLERFIHYKAEVLAFAKNFSIPFGNNLAEQAIRMMKVKQKISGCFRSEQGAKDFADIRSYIATMQKQGISILQALEDVISGNTRQVLA